MQIDSNNSKPTILKFGAILAFKSKKSISKNALKIHVFKRSKKKNRFLQKLTIKAKISFLTLRFGKTLKIIRRIVQMFKTSIRVQI